MPSVKSIQYLAIQRLEQAAEIVREGWVSGEWGTDRGACAAGGLMLVQKPTVFDEYSVGPARGTVNRRGEITTDGEPTKSYHFTPDKISRAAFAALASAISGQPVADDDFAATIAIIAPWNDSPDRTQDEVVGMFLAAAAILRASLPSEPQQENLAKELTV